MTQVLTLDEVIEQLQLWQRHFRNPAMKVILHVQSDDNGQYGDYDCVRQVTCGTWDGTAAIWISNMTDLLQEISE